MNMDFLENARSLEFGHPSMRPALGLVASSHLFLRPVYSSSAWHTRRSRLRLTPGAGSRLARMTSALRPQDDHDSRRRSIKLRAAAGSDEAEQDPLICVILAHHQPCSPPRHGQSRMDKATALKDGQPFTAYPSLTSVQFGTAMDPTADSNFFCESHGSCDLGKLCAKADDEHLPKLSAEEHAGRGVARPRVQAPRRASSCGWGCWRGSRRRLLLLRIAQVPTVGRLVNKLEQMRFTIKYQEMVISGCWGLLWALMFCAMTAAPSWCRFPRLGLISLEASFGLLLLVREHVHLWRHPRLQALLWDPHNVTEAWMEFSERSCSRSRRLYLSSCCSSAVSLHGGRQRRLVGAAHHPRRYYLDAERNMMVMYIVLVTISML